MSGPTDTMLTIKACHTYFNGQRDKSLRFVPAKDCLSLMKQYGLSYKIEAGQVQIARTSPNKNWPEDLTGASQADRLWFAVIPMSSLVLNYTDIAFEYIRNSCFFKNVTAMELEDEEQASLKHYDDFNDHKDWLYRVKALGLISIPFIQFIKSQTLKLTFKTRPVIWRYHIFLNSISSLARGEFRIEHSTKDMSFLKVNKRENDISEASIILESTEPKPFFLHGIKGLTLTHNVDDRTAKTISRNLPSASPQHLRLLSGDDIPRADIFVHI